MKYILCIALPALFGQAAFSQKDSLDLLTFQPPEGWKKETADGTASYVKTDQKTGSWCRISVYKSVPSKGSMDADLEKEWTELAVKQYHITDSMQATPEEEADGWKVKAASGQFVFNKNSAAAMLTTFSGYNRCASILVLANSQQFIEDIQDFLATIDIKKPDEGMQTQNNTVSPAAGSFTFNTTHFDDGWTSVIKDKWIEVTKGDITVFLLYGVPYNASDFSGTGVRARDYYWDNYVTKYYSVETKQYNDNGESMGSFQPDYVEGWAKDKATGRRRFIGMRLSIAPNAAFIVIASASDESNLRQQFPNANGKFTSDLGRMSDYNKFAVGKTDLVGKWSNSGGGTMSWYSTSTGQYAGATGAATSQVYHFNADGTYNSTHNGGYGVVGAMTTYQQEYKGIYTVTDWEVTATNRWQGKTETFSAWFEIVQGGRILHLHSSSDTALFKEQ